MQDVEKRYVWLTRAAMLVVVAGCIAGFAWFNWALDDQTREVNSFSALPPRTGIPVEVEEAGTYTIWAAAACGGLCDVPPLEDLYEFLTLGFEGPSGMVRPVPFPGQQSYRLNGAQHGSAAWLVEFDEPGTYVVERLNEGAGSVVLLLGEGEGMSTRITSGLVTIGITTLLLAGALYGTAVYQRRRALDDLVQRIHGGA